MRKYAIILILALSPILFYSCSNQGPAPGSGASNANISNDTANAANAKTYSIDITAGGFSPADLTINAGDRVNFTNKDSSLHWPASNPHPFHTDYPGSGVEKCSTPEQPNIFDACRGLSQGEIFSFVFREKGTWGYHDHKHHAVGGTITVK